VRDQSVSLVVDLNEAAQLLGMSTKTLRRLIYAGAVPAVQFSGKNGKLWIRRDEIDRWIERCTVPTGADPA
jgi:excisionase family DNA binding protein